VRSAPPGVRVRLETGGRAYAAVADADGRAVFTDLVFPESGAVDIEASDGRTRAGFPSCRRSSPSRSR
jgi:hypothetical protein